MYSLFHEIFMVGECVCAHTRIMSMQVGVQNVSMTWVKVISLVISKGLPPSALSDSPRR